MKYFKAESASDSVCVYLLCANLGKHNSIIFCNKVRGKCIAQCLLKKNNKYVNISLTSYDILIFYQSRYLAFSKEN